MSTQPQVLQSLMGKPTTAMAVAHPKQRSLTKNHNAAAKTKIQMHRRSRTGCYTCRLRRKKCDEGTACCSACKNLGLQCDYSRPMWWNNNEHRKQQKDQIKNIIKRKKLSEKATSATQVMTPGSDTPPELSHSVPTSSSYTTSVDRTRSASIDSSFSLDFDFSAPIIQDFTSYNAQIHSSHSQYAPVYPEFSPYDVDVKTERQMFVNDNLTRKESTSSTFSTYYPPPPDAMLPSFPEAADWIEDAYIEQAEPILDEPSNANFFQLSHSMPAVSSPPAIDLSENDLQTRAHFIDTVLPTMLPILELTNPSSRSDLVLSALNSNTCYLHCCLSIAAQHYKTTLSMPNESINEDIMRHRYATIQALCQALEHDENHHEILDATLGMIFFQRGVGRYDDALPDIPWHQHLQAAVSLVQKLELPEFVAAPENQHCTPPTNMTMTAWVDILGSTMTGCAPKFAHTYREKHLSTVNTSLGLRDMMGCEDRVLYLISEIACLEALKRDGMDDVQVCNHVTSLGMQIGLTEEGEGGPKLPFNEQGILKKQLSKNITTCFRLAARIYLCSLVPGFHQSQPATVGLVEKLAAALEFVPSGIAGYDRLLVWVYLIGGSVSTSSSSMRALFEERVMGLGELSDNGSFGKVKCLLREVWSHVDAELTPGGSGAPYICWRDVMQMKGWDFLLI